MIIMNWNESFWRTFLQLDVLQFEALYSISGSKFWGSFLKNFLFWLHIFFLVLQRFNFDLICSVFKYLPLLVFQRCKLNDPMWPCCFNKDIAMFAKLAAAAICLLMGLKKSSMTLLKLEIGTRRQMCRPSLSTLSWCPSLSHSYKDWIPFGIAVRSKNWIVWIVE